MAEYRAQDLVWKSWKHFVGLVYFVCSAEDKMDVEKDGMPNNGKELLKNERGSRYVIQCSSSDVIQAALVTRDSVQVPTKASTVH